MILWVAVAAAVAGALACIAALVVLRSASRHAAVVEKLDVRLSELSLRLERDRAGRRDEELVSGFAGLRDDLAILSTHVASLTGGQLDIKRVVSAAVGKEIAALIERVDDAEAKAADRALHLRDRIEAAVEAAARGVGAEAHGAEAHGDGGLLARIEARLDALSEPAPAPASPDPALAAALERIETRLAALGEGGRAETGATEAVETVVSEGVARVLDRLSEMQAAEARAQAATPAPPRRAPEVFDRGRVVTLIAPPQGGRDGTREAAG
jgi:hypothetical protein